MRQVYHMLSHLKANEKNEEGLKVDIVILHMLYKGYGLSFENVGDRLFVEKNMEF